MKRIGGFKEAVWAREKKKREENEMIRVKEAEVMANMVADVIKLALEGKESKVTQGATTQLVKSRQPPLWSGQKYDRWKIEVEKWYNNTKASDEKKYINLLKSLKKDKAIKEFMVRH